MNDDVIFCASLFIMGMCLKMPRIRIKGETSHAVIVRVSLFYITCCRISLRNGTERKLTEKLVENANIYYTFSTKVW